MGTGRPRRHSAKATTPPRCHGIPAGRQTYPHAFSPPHTPHASTTPVWQQMPEEGRGTLGQHCPVASTTRDGPSHTPHTSITPDAQQRPALQGGGGRAQRKIEGGSQQRQRTTWYLMVRTKGQTRGRGRPVREARPRVISGSAVDSRRGAGTPRAGGTQAPTHPSTLPEPGQHRPVTASALPAQQSPAMSTTPAQAPPTPTKTGTRQSRPPPQPGAHMQVLEVVLHVCEEGRCRAQGVGCVWGGGCGARNRGVTSGKREWAANARITAVSPAPPPAAPCWRQPGTRATE
jgi:hypothetical protein